MQCIYCKLNKWSKLWQTLHTGLRMKNWKKWKAAVCHLFQGEKGWTHRIHGMKAAAHVPNAAGDTPTSAEFNALLIPLRRVGILETS